MPKSLPLTTPQRQNHTHRDYSPQTGSSRPSFPFSPVICAAAGRPRPRAYQRANTFPLLWACSRRNRANGKQHPAPPVAPLGQRYQGSCRGMCAAGRRCGCGSPSTSRGRYDIGFRGRRTSCVLFLFVFFFGSYCFPSSTRSGDGFYVSFFLLPKYSNACVLFWMSCMVVVNVVNEAVVSQHDSVSENGRRCVPAQLGVEDCEDVSWQRHQERFWLSSSSCSCVGSAI